MAVNKYLDDRGLGTLIHEIRRSMVVAYKIRGSAIYADSAYVAHAQSQDPGYHTDIDSVGVWQYIDGVWTKIETFELGWVYNIDNTFTTANGDFVEGDGIEVPAGTNIVVAEVTGSGTPTYKWDLLGKVVDTSIYQTKRLIRPLNLFVNEISPSYATHSLLPSQEAKSSNPQVTEGMIAIMTDTSEYGDVYIAHLTENAIDADMWDIAWTKLGNQTTVEGALELIESVFPNTPITDQEIVNMFNA